MTVIEDMAQLVKYNSISGNKMNDVDVVYTMWSNLKKTEGMEVGQVINKICMGPSPSIYLSLKDQTSILKKTLNRGFQFCKIIFFVTFLIWVNVPTN